MTTQAMTGEGAFRRAFPGISDTLDRFVAESETRLGSSVGVALKLLDAGASVHIIVTLALRGHTVEASRIIWGGLGATISHKGRIVRAATHASRAASVSICRVLHEQLLTALDTLLQYRRAS